MDEPQLRIRESSAAEYFKGLVEQTLASQKLRARGLTQYYIVDMLCRFTRPDLRIPFNDDRDLPLALRLRRALDAGGMEQRVRLRNLGDFSLFMSGFYQDSLKRRAVDLDYYTRMGEYAYRTLASRDEDAFNEAYAELGHKFVPFMDVLNEMSEKTRMASPSIDVLRLYESWLRTGSTRLGKKLADQGIAPNKSIGSRFIQ